MSKLLIVDDHAETRETLTLTLGRQAFDVRWAGTGEEACALAFAEPPDVILLDIAMPGMDGIEVCHRLRARETTARVPIVIITAMPLPDLRDLCVAAGATAFLQKPFSPRELIQLIDGLLAGSGRPDGERQGTD